MGSGARRLRGFSPVADEARVALVDAHNSLGVDVEADEDASQQVAGRWTQRSHHVHDGWREEETERSDPSVATGGQKNSQTFPPLTV